MMLRIFLDWTLRASVKDAFLSVAARYTILSPKEALFPAL